jgi:hypothetical protein
MIKLCGCFLRVYFNNVLFRHLTFIFIVEANMENNRITRVVRCHKIWNKFRCRLFKGQNINRVKIKPVNKLLVAQSFFGGGGANRRSAAETITSIVRKWNIHHRVQAYKNPSLIPILRHTNPFHNYLTPFLYHPFWRSDMQAYIFHLNSSLQVSDRNF